MTLLSQKVLLTTETVLQDSILLRKNPTCEVCGDVMKTCIKGPNQVLFRCAKTVNKHIIFVNAFNKIFFQTITFLNKINFYFHYLFCTKHNQL